MRVRCFRGYGRALGVWAGSVLLTIAAFLGSWNTTYANTADTVRIGINGSLTGPLLPYRSPSSIWHTIIHQQFAPLLHLTSKLDVSPEIVSRWWYSASGKTLFMDIAKNAIWSDGQPVTSADVQLAINYLASPYYNNVLNGDDGYRVSAIVGAQTVLLGRAKDVSGFHVINDHEFYLALRKTNPSILAQDIQGIVPLPYHMLHGIPFSKFPSTAFFKNPSVGDGPYLLQNRVAGALIFGANPHFVLGSPHIGLIQYTSISSTSLPGLFQAGSIDLYSGITPSQVQQLSSYAKIARTLKDQVMFMGFNDQLPGANDTAFRQAILYSIDRPKIIQDILSGNGVIANGPIPSFSKYFDQSLTSTYEYNPQTARKLLQKSGFYIGGNSWITTPSGVSLHVILNYMQGNAKSQAIASEIVRDLQNIAINATLHGPLTIGQMVQAMQERNFGTIEAYVMGWQLGADPAPSTLWLPTSPLNLATMQWTDSSQTGVATNALLIAEQQTVAAQNVAYRTNLLKQWQDVINKNVPVEFLYDPELLVAKNHRLHHVVLSSLYGPDDSWTWTLS